MFTTGGPVGWIVGGIIALVGVTAISYLAGMIVCGAMGHGFKIGLEIGWFKVSSVCNMKKEIEISNPQKILPWISGPFMASLVFEGVVLIIGFTTNLLFINYLFEALFLFLFFLSYRNRYKCYKDEPNLKITKYFWVELGIHIFFIIASIIQSALNVWIGMNDSGLVYKHEFFFISLMILGLHVAYMFIDYYVSEKVAIIRYCRRVKKEKNRTHNI